MDTEPDAFERSVDMIRKLRAVSGEDGYTATALILAGWNNDDATPTVVARPELVPEDVRAAQFFDGLIAQMLRVTPVSHHVAVRERRERRHIAT